MNRVAVVTAVVFLLVASVTQAQVQSGSGAADVASTVPGDAAMEAFRALAAAHEEAMNRKDAGGVAATFTPTADHVFFDQPRLVGRDAIRDQLRSVLSAPQPFERFNLTVTSARMLANNIAIVETDATFTGAPQLANRGTMVVVRHQGRWLIESLRVYPAQATRP